MSQQRRQDFARPPGPWPEQDRKDKGDDWEIESPSRVSRLRTQFSVLRGDEQAILAVLRRVHWLDRFNARIALYQALLGPYFGGSAKAIELCEQVFGKGAVDFPSERVYWEQAAAAAASPPAPKKPPAPPSREALRALALRELLVKRVRAGNRPDEKEQDLLLGGLELGVVSRALLDMKELVVDGDPASPTCQAVLWEQERSYNLRSQFPYYLRAEPPGPETVKSKSRAHEVPRFVTETLTVPRFAGQHVLGSWETSAYKTRPAPNLNNPAIGELDQIGGEPLPEALLQRMNQLFAHDFAHVRIHTDARAARAAASLGARALAIGQHIYFAENHFAPGTPAGDRLLVHELMHVVQFDQGRLPVLPGEQATLSQPGDAAEREAAAAESRIEVAEALSTVSQRPPVSQPTKKSLARPSWEALRAQTLRELLVERVRAGNRPDEKEQDLVLGGLELGVVSRALLDMKEHVVPGDPASPTCKAVLWEQERSYNLRAQFPYYLQAKPPGPETVKSKTDRAHEVPRFVTEPLGVVAGLAGYHVLGSWETSEHKTRPTPTLGNPALQGLAQHGGQPLDGALLQRMNRLFGHDFRHVRIHTDAQSARVVGSLGARALAVGRHIYFAEGRFAPGTPAGDRLLVHELMHVVQFDRGRLPALSSEQSVISQPEDASEKEASAAEALSEQTAPERAPERLGNTQVDALKRAGLPRSQAGTPGPGGDDMEPRVHEGDGLQTPLPEPLAETFRQPQPQYAALRRENIPPQEAAETTVSSSSPQLGGGTAERTTQASATAAGAVERAVGPSRPQLIGVRAAVARIAQQATGAMQKVVASAVETVAGGMAGGAGGIRQRIAGALRGGVKVEVGDAGGGAGAAVERGSGAGGVAPATVGGAGGGEGEAAGMVHGPSDEELVQIEGGAPASAASSKPEAVEGEPETQASAEPQSEDAADRDEAHVPAAAPAGQAGVADAAGGTEPQAAVGDEEVAAAPAADADLGQAPAQAAHSGAEADQAEETNARAEEEAEVHAAESDQPGTSGLGGTGAESTAGPVEASGDEGSVATPAAEAAEPDAASEAGGDTGAESGLAAQAEVGGERPGNDENAGVAAGGGGGGGGGAIAARETPPAPDVSAMEPEQGLAQVRNLAPHRILQSLGGVSRAADHTVGEHERELEANPPQAEFDGGGSASQPGSAAAPGLLRDGHRRAERVSDPGAPETLQPRPLPAAPPTPMASVRQPRVRGNAQGNLSQADVREMQSSLRTLPTRDPGAAITAGPGPRVPAQGSADPAHIERQQAVLERQSAQTEAQGASEAAQPLGEGEIHPEVQAEMIRPEGGAVGDAGGAGAGASVGAGVGEAAGEEAASIVAQQERGGEIRAVVTQGMAEMAAHRQEHAQREAQERASGAQQQAQAQQMAVAEQAAARSHAQAEVRSQRQQWTSEQRRQLSQARSEGQKAAGQARMQVEQERMRAEREAARLHAEGERQAAEARRGGERKAAEEKRKGERESSGGGILGWVAAQARSFFDGIKRAVSAALDAARDLARQAIETARRAATAVVEAAKNTVVNIVRTVGGTLLSIADRLVPGFRALRERFVSAIHGLVDRARQLVTRLARRLRDGLQRIVNTVKRGLTGALGLLKRGLQAAVSAVRRGLQAAVSFARQAISTLGTFAGLIKDIAANPIGWIRNLGAAAMDGIRNHLWNAVKSAVSGWINSKVEQLTGIGRAVINLLQRGGISLAQLGQMVWEGIKSAIPPALIAILIEKVVSMIIPAAGAILAIIQSIQAAWGAISRILQAIDRFIAFLRAVKGGNAGPLFAQAVAAGIVAALEFVSSFLLRRLMGAASRVGGRIREIARRIAQRLGGAMRRVAGAARRGAGRVIGTLRRGAQAVGREMRRAGQRLAQTRIGQRVRDLVRRRRERRRRRRERPDMREKMRVAARVRAQVRVLDRVGVPTAAIVLTLKARFRARYRWIRDFVAEPLGDRRYLISMIASKIPVGKTDDTKAIQGPARQQVDPNLRELPAGQKRTPEQNRRARKFYRNNRQEAMRRWEKRTGQQWPTNPETGKPHWAEHPRPLAKGGDPLHVEPGVGQDPNAPHNVLGPDGLTDHERWGAEGGRASAMRRSAMRRSGQ